MSLLKIRNAIEKAVNVVAVANNIQISVENKPFSPKGAYVRVALFPSQTRNPSIISDHIRYVGVCRLTYCHPDVTCGMGPVENITQALIDAFPKGTVLNKDDVFVHIENTPYEGSPIYDATYVAVPIEMLYRADVFN